MLKGTLAALMGALCLLAFNSAQAFGDDGYTPGTTRLTLDAGLSGGGDKLATVFYTNGDTQSIYAGDGLFADFGVQRNLADTDWSLKATLGFDDWAVSASNATTTFDRYPLDLLAIYNIGRNHIGFGVTEHFSPRLDLDGYGPNVSFNNATGVMLQYQYWLFGLRLTSIRYTASGNCNGGCGTVSGNSLGVFFNYTF